MSDLRCVFECSNPEEGKLNPLNEDSFLKIKEVSRVRKHFKNLKYSELEFAENLSENDGYHRNCKKNFMKLDRHYFVQYEEGTFIYINSRLSHYVFSLSLSLFRIDASIYSLLSVFFS